MPAVLPSCVHLPGEAPFREAASIPEDIRKEYSYPRYSGDYKEESLGETESVLLSRVTFPSARNLLPIEHEIIIDYYRLKSQKPAPVIMVLPILGGGNSVAESFAKFFSEKGFSAVIVHRQEQFKDLDRLDRLDKVLRQIVLDHMQVLDWMESREELDHGKIGVFGVSMGAIKGSLVGALDSRIRAQVLALGAGDLPYVLAYSTESGVEKRRARFMEENRLSPGEVHRSLEKIISCDPIRYAPFVSPENVLMILALFDSAVPIQKGRELRKALGTPQTIYLPSGHYSSIIFIGYVKYKALHFFRETLGARSG